IGVLAQVPPTFSYRESFKNYKILTLPCAYILLLLVNSYKHKSSNFQHLHDHSTRIRGGTRMYNMIPDSLKKLDLNPFKNRMKNFLMITGLYSVNEYFCHKF
ncbi:hypothetical protein HHI36_003860, partial [Cryptolaemus montrouzieri]